MADGELSNEGEVPCVRGVVGMNQNRERKWLVPRPLYFGNSRNHRFESRSRGENTETMMKWKIGLRDLVGVCRLDKTAARD